MIGPAGLLQRRFENPGIDIGRQIEVFGEIVHVHHPHGPAPAFPLTMQSRSVENANGGFS